MGKKFLLGTGLLIATYLVVSNATGFGRSVQAASSAYVSGVKVLQGR